MKSTTRGSVAAVLACVASAVGAGAVPAAAAPSVPVNLPLESLEHVLPVPAPELATGVPVPVPHAPEAPAHVAGRLLPYGALPRVPLSTELPVTEAGVPVTEPLGDRELGVARIASEAAELSLATPGASLGAPLSAPRPELYGQPEPVLSEVAVLTPTLRGAPAAGLLLDR
ncbi:hypothetical protein ABZ714_26440 [Streptomyces sp. NPDC006798]|uniref:hypothetical protein n=1 Tax=Streptomyces sp. NPDC006798 TaxID=3155462 RepID=UPI0033ED61E7